MGDTRTQTVPRHRVLCFSSSLHVLLTAQHQPNQPTNQPTTQSTNQSTNQPTNQSTNQLPDPPINQSLQPTDQPTNRASYFSRSCSPAVYRTVQTPQQGAMANSTRAVPRNSRNRTFCHCRQLVCASVEPGPSVGRSVGRFSYLEMGSTFAPGHLESRRRWLARACTSSWSLFLLTRVSVMT